MFVYNGLLQSAASELGARMTAMTSATDNAGELLDKLTVHYNKVRQSGITNELTEIVSGANALQ
jgi:F-type H+-transporting ATPase subunit gamma